MSRGRTETSASYSECEPDDDTPANPQKHSVTATQTMRKQTQRKIINLEVQIQSLKQRKTILHRQLQRRHLNRISMPEMTKFKAEVKEFRNRSDANHLTELIDQLVETLREKSIAKVTCETLERKIKAEIQNRDDGERLHRDISEVMDFSEFSVIQLPLTSTFPYDNIELESHRRHLNELKSEVLKDTMEQTVLQRQKEAAGEVARSTSAEVTLARKNREVIQISIDSMKAILRDLQADVARVEGENQILTNRKKTSEREGARKSVESQQKNQQQMTLYKRELQMLDQDVAQLKQKIDSSAEKYEKICEAIANLQIQGAELAGSRSEIFELSDESYSDDVIEQLESEEAASVEQMFREQRDKLQRDVDQLRREYERQKSLKKTEHGKLQQDIQRLYSKLQTNERMIQYFDDTSQSSYHSFYDLLNPASSVSGTRA